MTRRLMVMVVGVLISGLSATQAGAQGSRWEVEVHGGFAGGSTPEGGDTNTTPAGQGFSTLTLFPSRRVSSWMFGDGAALFNAANAAFPSGGGRITAIDSAFEGATASGSSGSFGFRVGYVLTPRVTLEFNLDSTPADEWSDGFLDALEVTRASFVSGWNGLIGTGSGVVFVNPSVTATADINEKGGRHLLTTGALTYSFGPQRAITPYVTVGAGLQTSSGDGPTATIAGNYQFSSTNVLAAPRFLVNETDTVTLRSVSGSSFAMLFGGGLKFAVSPTWGIRGDVRAHIIANANDVELDASPATQASNPSGAIASTLNPSLQFATSAPGLVSSLSGPPISGFKVFEGSGYAVQINAAAGVYFRF